MKVERGKVDLFPKKNYKQEQRSFLNMPPLEAHVPVDVLCPVDYFLSLYYIDLLWKNNTILYLKDRADFD